MKVISRPRQAGKTYDLIKFADGKPGYIVVMNQKEARRIFDMAHEMKAKIRFPITYQDMLHNMKASFETELYIDNIEFLLWLLSGKHTVKAFTVNSDKGDLHYLGKAFGQDLYVDLEGIEVDRRIDKIKQITQLLRGK